MVAQDGLRVGTRAAGELQGVDKQGGALRTRQGDCVGRGGQRHVVQPHPTQWGEHAGGGPDVEGAGHAFDGGGGHGAGVGVAVCLGEFAAGGGEGGVLRGGGDFPLLVVEQNRHEVGGGHLAPGGPERGSALLGDVGAVLPEDRPCVEGFDHALEGDA